MDRSSLPAGLQGEYNGNKTPHVKEQMEKKKAEEDLREKDDEEAVDEDEGFCVAGTTTAVPSFDRVGVIFSKEYGPPNRCVDDEIPGIRIRKGRRMEREEGREGNKEQRKDHFD